MTQLRIESIVAMVPCLAPLERGRVRRVCEKLKNTVETHEASVWKLHIRDTTCMWRLSKGQRVFSLIYLSDCRWWVKTEAHTTSRSYTVVEKHIISEQDARWPSDCFFGKSLVARHLEEVRDIVPGAWLFVSELRTDQRECFRTGQWVISSVGEGRSLNISPA